MDWKLEIEKHNLSPYVNCVAMTIANASLRLIYTTPIQENPRKNSHSVFRFGISNKGAPDEIQQHQHLIYEEPCLEKHTQDHACPDVVF